MGRAKYESSLAGYLRALDFFTGYAQDSPARRMCRDIVFGGVNFTAYFPWITKMQISI